MWRRGRAIVSSMIYCPVFVCSVAQYFYSICPVFVCIAALYFPGLLLCNLFWLTNLYCTFLLYFSSLAKQPFHSLCICSLVSCTLCLLSTTLKPSWTICQLHQEHFTFQRSPMQLFSQQCRNSHLE